MHDVKMETYEFKFDHLESYICSKTDLFPVIILSINFECTSPAIVLEAIFATYPEKDSTKTFTGEQ